jgi:hypothetical protein
MLSITGALLAVASYAIYSSNVTLADDAAVSLFGLDMSMTIEDAVRVLEARDFTCKGGVFEVDCVDSTQRMSIKFSGLKLKGFSNDHFSAIEFSCEATQTCGMNREQVANKLVYDHVVPEMHFVKSPFPDLWDGDYQHIQSDGTVVTVATYTMKTNPEFGKTTVEFSVSEK